MKKLKPLIESLDAKTVSVPSGWENIDVHRVFASDLISDILVSSGDRILLITSLLSDQMLRTADVIGAVAVILVNRKSVPAMLGKVAAKQGLPLFHTPLQKFESCVRLGRLMESE